MVKFHLWVYLHVKLLTEDFRGKGVRSPLTTHSEKQPGGAHGTFPSRVERKARPGSSLETKPEANRPL